MTNLIIGAGPAGLTAARELQRAGLGNVRILEAGSDIGGLSKTVNYQGNRIDIGGHRFFSKSDWVMDWWRAVLPVAAPEGLTDGKSFRLAYQGAERLLGSHDLAARESDSAVMLVRNRLSRIYWGGKLFDYPLKPGLDMATKLGPLRCLRLGASYARAAMLPIRPEVTLEHFFINRFGSQLYQTFFKEYTEKVWGVPCSEISAAWGAQRVKSLSIMRALLHAARTAIGSKAGAEQTSLIEHFLYPKFGPGQMWEAVADEFTGRGGHLCRDMKVVHLELQQKRVTAVVAQDAEGHNHRFDDVGNVISTMAVRDLFEAMGPAVPPNLRDLAGGLQYRDFITVGLLYRSLRTQPGGANSGQSLPDNWIYIQEPGVKVGRLQIFNNWSPFMAKDPNTIWVGLEFFARDDDDLWGLSDAELKALAVREMQQLNLGEASQVLDATVIRMPKAYPGYFGESYQRFDELKSWLDSIGNLYLIGRNGMHRYNNQDHSMLTAKAAVDAIKNGGSDREAIWAINIDDEYHEQADKAR